MLDTDIVIDYLRGNAHAVEFLEHTAATLLLSAMTVAELYAGVREGHERGVLDKLLGAFLVIAVDADIAARGGLLRRDYGRSHGIGIADAIIAASAEKRNATLVTLNKKHFPMLPNVVVPYEK
jgi:predicted nucleic acid-binding protein